MSDAAARWRRVEEICHAALARDAGERAAFLTGACGDDDQLRREVDTLVAHEASADGFLSSPLAALAAEVLGEPNGSLVGCRIGVYQVVSPLGAGGMGAVYRARDTQLGRDVAIKVLPASFTADRERAARFEREARVLASLNHPHIGAIYGVEPIDPATGSGQMARALILELVEGETLADRITKASARRPQGMPVADALSIARQIAAALEAAQEKGIVHRDLKPANIKITPAGVVKVLDFGLAKPGAGWAGQTGRDVAQPPTSTLSGTHEGVLLGTAAYMSPEQARGQAVDKRADIWAFGCVLFEMLTGRLAFQGDTVSDHIAAILGREPDWTALPAAVPSGVRRLLRRCLEKDATRRLHDIADARIEIDDTLASPANDADPLVAAPSRRVAALVIAALAGGALVAALAMQVLMRPAAVAPELPLRFTIAVPAAQSMNISGFDRDVAISPDGRRIVYRSGGSFTAGSPLLVRAIDQLDAVPLAGVGGAYSPFFSPDGRWVGFFEDGELRKISTTGGPAVTLCPVTGGLLGASWGDDNSIVFAASNQGTGLWSVSADGGAPTLLTKADPAHGETHHVFPSVLPGGRAVLFTITAAGGAKNSQVAVFDRKTGRRKTLVRGGSQAEYIAASTGQAGYLIYAAGALQAVRFDPVQLEVRDTPVAVVEHVMVKGSGAANYAVSRSGALVFVSGGADAQRPPRSLVWVDRNGREQPINAPVRTYGEPRLSPDGTRVVVPIADDDTDLWIWDLARETLTRATFGAGLDGMMPVWTPDSRQIIFMSTRSGLPNLYTMAADGTGAATPLETSAIPRWPTSITPDGRTVIGFELVPKARPHVILLPLARSASDPRVQTLFNGSFAEISPDGRYVAYQWNELGHIEVYVRPFPDVDSGRWQISTGGGSRPAWGGRELFYLDSSNTMIAVPVQTSGSTFVAGNHVKVFDNKYPEPNPARHYDVSRDGQRFLMIKDSTADDPKTKQPGMVVVEHWFEELRASVPAARP